MLRVNRNSQLSKRASGAIVVGPRRPSIRKNVIANDFRSLWKSILIDRCAKRIFVIHGPWQLSKVRVITCRLFRVKAFAVNWELIRTCNDYGFYNVEFLPLGPRANPGQISPKRRAGRVLVAGQISRIDPIKRIDLFGKIVSSNGINGVLVCPIPENEADARELQNLSRSGISVFQDGEPRHVWENCNLYFCTSEYESLGLAMLEALQRGIPVISLAKGGPEEFLKSFLALGSYPGATPEHLNLEKTYRKIEAHWNEYWEDAQSLLRNRNISKCADIMLG